MSPAGSSLVETKKILEQSGEKAGSKSADAVLVSRVTAEPSTGHHIDLFVAITL